MNSHTPSRLFLIGILLGCAACSGAPTPHSVSPESVPVATAPANPRQAAVVEQALASGYCYDKLGELCDTIGHRLVGSPGMNQAISWSMNTMLEAGYDSVWTEPVTAPHWTRGREWARCTAPMEFDLPMLGLGRSVGTGKNNPDGIEAEILAVRDFAELEARAAEAAGKIVLFNPPWEGYGRTVLYRRDGASAAARHGAVACLIRSVTGVSLATPHTGTMRYAEDVPQIPIAALTVEDAGRLHRMCQRGLRPRVRLFMEAANHGDIICHNVVGEVRGTELPDEWVLVGGHLDSWDVGTSAHDDGAGVVLSLAVGQLLAQQDLRPRRTVRIVLFTSEEFGGQGGRAYLEAHRHELSNHVLALESDSGAFTPRGFSVAGEDTILVETIRRMASPLAHLAPETWRVEKGWSGVDIRPIVLEGVPGVGHRVVGDHYFDVHHSPADTFEKIDPDKLARNLAAMAGLVFAVADSPVPLQPDHSNGGNR